MYSLLWDFLSDMGISYKSDQLLSEISTVKIGGLADLIIYPRTEEELIRTLRFMKENALGYYLVGGASNVLFRDEGMAAPLICTKCINGISVSGETVNVQCGVSVPSLCATLARAGLSGIEELCGIPGTVGGALASNAGAFGREIGDAVISAKVYIPSDDKIVEAKRCDLGFTYRSTSLIRDGITVLSVSLGLSKGESELIFAKMREICEMRRASQPCGLPSLGSTFKRSNGVSAGELIDKCGLKGFKLGGASISNKHAGFIVNDGGALACDYLKLMSIARSAVFEKFQVKLEPEIKVLG